MTESNTQLQAFFLYCQAVETAYNEWKNYWVTYFLNDKSKDLYDASEYSMDTWFENLKKINRNLTWQ